LFPSVPINNKAKMKFVTLLLVLLGLGYVQASCSTNCSNGVEDDIFVASSEYGDWGMSYVRDPSLPVIQAAHSADITTAVIIIHGNARDAYNYYCYMNYAVDTAGVRSSTYIISPHFYLKPDVPPPKAFYWATSAGWKEGGRSHTDTTRISSFQILDEMVAAFHNKNYFPGMKEVLVVGHSAGGQTVQRYAFATGVDVNYKVRYVIENPGSYAYLDISRAVLPELTLPTCTACISEEIMTTKYEFKNANRSQEQDCPEYNDWKMGYEDGNLYSELRSAKTVRDEYKNKDISYILGTNDTCNTELGSCGCNDNSLDTGCDALMQGYCRFQRGVIFYQYLQYYYNTTGVHNLSFVQGLAHDGCGMINSAESILAMFPINPTEAPITSNTTTSTSISARRPPSTRIRTTPPPARWPSTST
jgi:pimeloyl-ACP methyl ester carboxylesterase